MVYHDQSPQLFRNGEVFSLNNYFGLNKERISFFKQGMMPVFDLEGKIL